MRRKFSTASITRPYSCSICNCTQGSSFVIVQPNGASKLETTSNLNDPPPMTLEGVAVNAIFISVADPGGEQNMTVQVAPAAIAGCIRESDRGDEKL